MLHLLIAWWFSMAMLVTTRWYIYIDISPKRCGHCCVLSRDEPQVSKCLVKMAPPKAEEKKLGHLLLIWSFEWENRLWIEIWMGTSLTWGMFFFATFETPQGSSGSFGCNPWQMPPKLGYVLQILGFSLRTCNRLSQRNVFLGDHPGPWFCEF